MQKSPSTTLSPNDRISNLPDELLSRILSRLSTKFALKTSVLSRTWRHKWTYVCDFNLSSYGAKNDDMVTFINLVTRILTLTSRIRSFTLFLSRGDTFLDRRYLENWVSCALMRNVEILSVSAMNHRPDSWCFRGWTLLTKLFLCTNCTLVLPVNNIFPNLKRLILIYGDIRIKPEQVPSEGRIILTFPVLEYIFLECEWLNVTSVEIHAPELIAFDTHGVDAFKNYKIKIFAAKLDTFMSQLGSFNSFDLQGSPAVSSLKLDHSLEEHHAHDTCLVSRAYRILTQSPNLKCLTLAGDLVRLLLPSKSALKFPTFNQLKELKLGYSICTKDVMELLQLLPQVESLGVDVKRWNDIQETGEPWSPKSVSNLKELKLQSFSGHMLQWSFSYFVLENAKNLKELNIAVGRDAPAQVKAMAKLLSRSSSCAIKISSKP